MLLKNTTGNSTDIATSDSISTNVSATELVKDFGTSDSIDVATSDSADADTLENNTAKHLQCSRAREKLCKPSANYEASVCGD